MKREKTKLYFWLHLLLMLYSMGGILSKMAAKTDFLSLQFCVFYSGIIGILGIYAIGWQQIIKRMPLTTAFANKAVTVVWGIIWGCVMFHEQLTMGKLMGAGLVMAGVVLYAQSDEEKSDG